MAVGSCSDSRANDQFGLYKVHPDGTHLRPILGLSDFAPRLIDWGASTQHGDDGPGDGNQDDGDRQDGETITETRLRPRPPAEHHPPL